MTVEFSLLGDVQATIDGEAVELGHARQRCVLAALLVDCNRPVPVDRLVDRVWGDRLPQRARGTVYSYLSRLRGLLASAEDAEIVRRPGGYVLAVDPLAVDLHRFQHLVAEARQTADGDRAEELLDEGLGLWRGEAFGLLDTPWLAAARVDLHEQRLAAQLDRFDLALAHGRTAELLPELTTTSLEHDLDERLAGQLMLALYRSGRQAGALEVYDQLRRRLAAELGADPGGALSQLHQQILQADPDLLRLSGEPGAEAARAGLPPVPRQLPALPGSFTGRSRELADLSAATDADPTGARTVVISAIGGAGGIGKTWLALRWANDNLDRFPDGQLYVNLRGFDPASEPVLPAVAVRGFLDTLGVEPGRIPVDLDAQAGLYRSLVADRHMLIVLDNARDTDQVSSLLPGTSTCTVLVTSRNELGHLAIAHGARRLELDVLADREARSLLVRHLGRPRIDAEPDSVTAVLEHCGGLPLALGIIAARAASHPDFPIAGLASELRDESTRLDALDTGELATNLRAAMSCSYRALSDEAARVFRLLALAPGPDIGLLALASLIDEPVGRARMVLRQLVNAHLAYEHVPGRYRMHDLVRLYATETADALGTADEREDASHRVLDHYLHTAYDAALLLDPFRQPITLAKPLESTRPEPIADYDQAFAWFSVEHAVLLAAVDRAASERLDVLAWQLAWTLTMFLDLAGHRRDAATAQRVALGAAERTGDRPAQASAHRRLAISAMTSGRLDEAHGHLRQALEVFEELGDLSSQGNALIDLARLLEFEGRPNEAQAHARTALELHRADGNGAGQATALNAIGWMQIVLGELDQAVTSCEQALRLTQDLGFRLGEANTYDSLGYAHHELGHYAEARSCFDHALELFVALGDRSNEAATLDRLGTTHDAAGDRDLATSAWRRALTIFEELAHPEADAVRAKLAAAGPITRR